ncbi:helix-turn-helix domain-containing protein, partial [Streptomyces sp. 8N616]
MSQERSGAGADALAVLELLSEAGPADRLDTPVQQARKRGVTGVELEAVEHARRLGLAIHAQLYRRQQRETGLTSLVDTARELAALH